jgi:hypothetical protein
MHAPAGLFAIHPIVEAPGDGYFHSAWLLRRRAFLRFDYDPDAVFSKKTERCGFKKEGLTRNSMGQPTGFARAQV